MHWSHNRSCSSSAAYLDLRFSLQATSRLDCRCCLSASFRHLFMHVPGLGTGDIYRRAASPRRARSPRRQTKHTTRTANNTLYSINHSATLQINTQYSHIRIYCLNNHALPRKASPAAPPPLHIAVRRGAQRTSVTDTEPRLASNFTCTSPSLLCCAPVSQTRLGNCLRPKHTALSHREGNIENIIVSAIQGVSFE